MLMKIVFVCLIAVILNHAWKVISFMRPSAYIHNHTPGPCHLVPGVDRGSEDLHLLKNGLVLVSSGIEDYGMSRNSPGDTKPGRLLLFDFNKPNEVEELKLPARFTKQALRPHGISVFQTQDSAEDFGTFRISEESRPGRLLLFDFNKPNEVEELKLPDRFAKQHLFPHGISVFQPDNSDVVTVFVVNHQDNEPEKIEKFHLDLRTHELTYLKSIEDELFVRINDILATSEHSFDASQSFGTKSHVTVHLEVFLMLRLGAVHFYNGKSARTVVDGLFGPNGIDMSADGRINDIVATSEDSFYASQDWGTKSHLARHFEAYLMMRLGAVFYHDGKSARTVVDGLMFPNGIDMSADGRYVYLSHIGDKGVNVYERDANTNDLTLVQVFPTHTGQDNLIVDAQGDIWTGAHQDHNLIMAHLANGSIPAPSQVLRLKTDKGLITSMTEVYSDNGHTLFGSSSAVHHQGNILIGTVRHKMMVCQLKTG